MRVCRVCSVSKALVEFALRDANTGRRQWICKACFTIYSRAYYEAHRPQYLMHKRRNLRRYRARNRAHVLEYLSGKGCIDCGEADAQVLEFDHIGGAKRDSIAQLVQDGVSIQVLDDELAKCAVRCANCHRRKTVRDLGWYRSSG